MIIKNITLLFFITILNMFYAQNNYNNKLKIELDSIYLKDQIIREYISKNTTDKRKIEIETFLNFKSSNMNDVFLKMHDIDSINIRKVGDIIDKYGYAGKSLVGEPTNKYMWFVIQHSNRLKKYYKIIKNAGKKNEIPKTLVATMKDRILIREGKKQVYGTQASFKYFTNKKTGMADSFQFINPIVNPKDVNKKRKKIGFTTTIEQNPIELGIVKS